MCKYVGPVSLNRNTYIHLIPISFIEEAIYMYIDPNNSFSQAKA